MQQQKDWSIDEIQNTWQLVSKLHDGQKYGGSNEGERVEYINHIGSVVFEVLNAVRLTENMNADLAVKCAMLHDTIEDTAFTYEKVIDLFGPQVASGVLALTKNEEIEDSFEKMRDSLNRIKKQPIEVWAVKMADRICNLYEPPYYWSDEKKLKYIEEAEIIHNELKDGNVYLAERLKTKIQEYYRFLSTANQL
ncbi:bifunctional (p)ppGpp synthetase/guanosine-3',5'-bis(diphosphate) 3'-pyrophosphohydrolase [Flavobacterium sp. GN10]|uniref:Bifunctional (P)ppGpp synthetase/guanosine-3',5'-bis(Diphosphate) 3'-pyrophosphohydrolase n=1 Tax=Flavobacterium tagetis TaxID=2801336 RepID=A0ABS1KEN9_9FLAO|nr:HD domain-containing protein [Flavobacterium tagetis]MBL0737950.1 bifunctional (p)ppGpp synthetase/guanosine-3',5'-bis(diphosphate) 3'-pyrophosphohydrolase [Flavobacterium tagetis]